MTTFERLITLVFLLAPVIVGGTVFFHYVEGWSWVDSYFFSVVTLSTVGYGSIVPVTTLGKIGTTIYIFLGLGIFAFVIQQIGHIAAEKRAVQLDWLISRLGHHEDDQKPPQTENRDGPRTP